MLAAQRGAGVYTHSCALCVLPGRLLALCFMSVCPPLRPGQHRPLCTPKLRAGIRNCGVSTGRRIGDNEVRPGAPCRGWGKGSLPLGSPQCSPLSP